MVSCWRFELQTLWLKVKCSTDWANRTKLKWLPRMDSNHRNVRVKVWCLATWLRGNIWNGGRRWIWTIEPEGTDLQSAAFGHFAILPSLRKFFSFFKDNIDFTIYFCVCEHFFWNLFKQSVFFLFLKDFMLIFFNFF